MKLLGRPISHLKGCLILAVMGLWPAFKLSFTLILATSAVVFAAGSASAQTSLLRPLSPALVAPVGPPAAPSESPKDGVLAVMAACRTQDTLQAELYLDLRAIEANERAAEALTLACQAKAVFDRLLPTSLSGLSTLPTGDLNDGMPPQLDLLLTQTTEGGDDVSLYQERYTDKAGRSRWRLTAASVAKLPALYDEFALEHWEKSLPQFAVKHAFLDIKMWQWAALFVLTLLAASLSRAAGRLMQLLVGRLMGSLERGQLMTEAVHRASIPFRILLGLGLFSAGTLPLHFSLAARQRLWQIEGATLVVIVAWFLINVGDAATEVARFSWLGRDRPGTAALLPLIQRINRTVIGITAVLVLLQTFGINVTAVLAGLGVGGLAVALAAQKTVENFFGGMMIAIDQPVRVGDYCRFGNQTGTVEDIGLRSTRLRTLNRTMVTIPNGEFSQLQIENLSKRDKISFTTILSLDSRTSSSQIKAVLEAIRELLKSDARVDQPNLDVRLVSLGGQSLDLELFGYILTTDATLFKAVREELYLRLMELVEERGLVFALPAHFSFTRTLASPSTPGSDKSAGSEASSRLS